MLKKGLLNSVLMLIMMTLLLGFIYPLIITAIAKFLFPYQASGSLIYKEGRVVGSKLIGQQFDDPRYFHGRPSMAGMGYDATSSGGSNLGPTNKKLIELVKKRAQQFRLENQLSANQYIPADIVTASASGLDPDITPEAALLQVPRIARLRGISEETLVKLVEKYTKERQLGFLGARRVNVLELNLALDHLQAGKGE
ncbi:potassium-transporting ATPase subunit KdpC [Caldicellulosiruptor acetigenus]|uniref:potassium-transporting ATPase subunit KdpC n=1 Tax=Caldicellulosiruptor acetigenus TaxID=301953 RepID=UPI0003FDFB77|nr:potassium-transporting ATPase subunit KdpC [Caldicellulosiruptor acetigenus]WAM35688.1 potassium-transporting ATPase subunit KdpC [Caldicellulosiruptor acetigenus]